MFTTSLKELLSTEEGRVPWLDLLRSIAILLVIGGHCLELGFSGPATNAFYWGWTGVDLFFVLSGYLIGGQLWKEIKVKRDVNVPRFLLRRGFRIWPLYFVVVTAYAIWDLFARRSVGPLLGDLSFLSNFIHSQVKGGWSLSTEEQFYILIPIILLLFRKAGPHALVLLPVTWLFLLPALRYWALANAPDLSVGEVIYMPSHLHSDGLAAGLVLAWVSIFCARWWQSADGRHLIPALLIAAGVALRCSGQNAFSYTAIAFIYTGITLFGLRAPYANRIASWKGFQLIAQLSYGAYLNNLVLIESLHVPAIRFLHVSSNGALMLLLTFFMISAASIVLAFVSFCLIEKPALIWRESWAQTRSCKTSFQNAFDLYERDVHVVNCGVFSAIPVDVSSGPCTLFTTGFRHKTHGA